MDMRSLERYAEEGYNVLLTGRHGVGKTAIVKQIFQKKFGQHNVGWKYFSASTLDPWVDVIGIPKNYTRADGKEVFTIVPPEHFTGDEKIQGLFFDEINRADEKILNALMELIQFKSINGRKFPHLKCVWAAENPANDENEYSVKPLDPAQKDRFQIQLLVPEELNEQYFTQKYGKDIYKVSNSWWASNKKVVSPRKLDDMLTGYLKGFNLFDFSHTIKTIKELSSSLDSVGELTKMKGVLASKDEKSIKNFFTLDYIRKHEKAIKSAGLSIEIEQYTQGEIKEYTKKIGIDPENSDYNLAKKYTKDIVFGRYVGVVVENFFSYLDDFSKLKMEEGLYIAKLSLICPFYHNPNEFSTFQIRELVSEIIDTKKRLDLTKDWFSKMTWLCSNPNLSKDTRNRNVIDLLKKLAGNANFVQALGINKKFFNEAMKTRVNPSDVKLKLYQA